MPPPDSSVPAAWTVILDNIQQTLTRSLATVAERERPVGPEYTPAAAGPDGWEQVVAACDARLDGLRTHVQRAERDAAEADATLLAGEKTLQYWLEALAAVRHRLAEGQVHPIGSDTAGGPDRGTP